MSKIKILPDNLSNKIAAGEVVERPASVVKELIENAIDAGSTRINIDIEKGGRNLIRIADNGSGMTRDDAVLAIERYATSKIYTDTDLFSIGTLGFRGEALPSIASVSEFTLVTRKQNADAGTAVTITGGKLKNITDAGAPPGTMISVEKLFYNVPARRKFLKGINTEMGHITDTISSIALGWPGITFRLTHNGKPVKNWPATKHYPDRIAGVLGSELRPHLHEIRFDDGYAHIMGWVSSPQYTRSSSQKMYTYVNGRHIRDRGLLHAMLDGYRGRLMKGRYPISTIFITIPHDQLDVNVHPTKHEVRFADRNRIYHPLKNIVIKALESAEQSKWTQKSTEGQSNNLEDRAGKLRDKLKAPSKINRTFEFGFKQDGDTISEDTVIPVTNHIPEPVELHERTKVISSPPETHIESHDEDEQNIQKKQAPITRLRFSQDLYLIGQYQNTYILCGSKENLILIDQHAAHERIVYEDLKNRIECDRVSSQKLLIPETLELNYKEKAVLQTLIPELSKIGFEIEPFGGSTFVIKALPQILSDSSASDIITDIVETRVQTGFKSGTDTILDESLIMMSCHSAIRANQTLTMDQMQKMLTQLDQLKNSAHCPHGRPIWITWSEREIEKSFKRIV